MNTFLLIVSSPDGTLFSEQVVSLSVRGAEGDLAILAGHTPFVTTVKPCTCKIEKEDGSMLEAQTGGGILTVSKEKVTFLSGVFTWNA
jgi:F0F1-type ATP synthase epsilon subunit